MIQKSVFDFISVFGFKDFHSWERFLPEISRGLYFKFCKGFFFFLTEVRAANTHFLDVNHYQILHIYFVSKVSSKLTETSWKILNQVRKILLPSFLVMQK